FQSASQHASELLEAQLSKMTDRQAKKLLQEYIGQELERLREGQYFSGIYKYISLLYPERVTLMDYVPNDTLFIMDEPSRFIETAKQFERDEAEWITESLQQGVFLPSFAISQSFESLM